MHHRHLVLQIPERFGKYFELICNKKASFFDETSSNSPHNIIKIHFVGSQVPFKLLLDKNTKHFIIGEALFQNDDSRNNIKINAL